MYHYYKKYQPKEYLVRANDQVIHCHMYKEMTLKVPVKPEEKVYTSYWDKFWNSTDEELDEEVRYKKITVLYIQDVQEETAIYFITEKDKAIVKSAMECGATGVEYYTLRNTNYRRACYRLYTENRYRGYHSSYNDEFDEEYFTDSFKVLYGCFKRRSYLIAVQSLDDIKEQFVDQVLEEKQKYEVKKINQKEKRIFHKENLERLRDLLLERIRESKEKHFSRIVEEFYQLDLLNKPTMTNDEKIKEYAAICEFCVRHMPVLRDRSFDLRTLRTDYPDYIDQSCFDAFFSNWQNINRSYRALVKGARGEKKVLEVLQLYDDRIHILHGYTWGCEHDFVVISPFGIYTIEVKNLYGEYVITQTGLLKSISCSMTKPKDIALQSKRHIETLRRNLRDCEAFSNDIPLFEVVCSAEPSFSVSDEYGYIPVCYYNTLDKILLPVGAEVVLSEENMLAIKNYLIEHWAPAFAFPCKEIDNRDKFIQNFADVASGFYVAHHSLPANTHIQNQGARHM